MASRPTLYTKQGTDKAIVRAVEPLATKAELSGYATKGDVATAAAGGRVDLTDYAKKAELRGLATREELSGYATTRQVADLASRADLTAYATKDEIVGVAKRSDLTGLATKAELSGYATKGDVAGVAHASDLTGLATKAELQAALTGVGITVVATEAEAQRLPDGALYFLAAAASPAQPPTPTPGPAPAAGPIVGQTITVKVDGKAGDKIVLGINEKAQGGRATANLPQGWTTLVDPYWVGTMSATIITGPWAPTITITMSQNAEIGWAAAAVRGASRIEAGTVKKRQAEPVETKTCTAPALAGAGLALGFTFERTSAGETSDQVTVSEGWEKMEFAAQEGLNYQTVTLATRTAASPADLVVTYPNVQGSNGIGVQVVARG